MGFEIILVGALLGFIMIALQEHSQNKKVKKKPESRVLPIIVGRREYYPPISHYGQTSVHSLYHEHSFGYLSERARAEALLRRLRQSTQARNRVRRIKRNSMVETWHRSIVGLVRSADKNLEQAQQHLKSKNYKDSIRAVSAGMENIARALIHCFGGKPNVDTGQQEPLRMLVSRLNEEEKSEFKQAIDVVVYIDNNRRAVSLHSTNKLQNQPIDEQKNKEILKSALKVNQLFKKIIMNHFLAEIPELSELCSKCGSMNISIWGFTEQSANYQCNNCRNTWTSHSKQLNEA